MRAWSRSSDPLPPLIAGLVRSEIELNIKLAKAAGIKVN
jgi:hypothetical protein